MVHLPLRMTVIGGLMTFYLMDLDQQLGDYRATCDLVARQQNSQKSYIVTLYCQYTRALTFLVFPRVS